MMLETTSFNSRRVDDHARRTWNQNRCRAIVDEIHGGTSARPMDAARPQDHHEVGACSKACRMAFSPPSFVFS